MKSKNEIRIAALFRDAPEAFLRMIVVHELSPLKEHDHNKAFYQLYHYMEPSYLQL
ncbi:YgjP-like metallopeptidase domain-containing protein [Methylobacillus sp. Pita1]|uniref:YgjP-like metallopeptidase domain-containing protein n=1 Tax=Methylobacillus sp. Pita1 TaxID=3382642 RepID=UPI0038B57D31